MEIKRMHVFLLVLLLFSSLFMEFKGNKEMLLGVSIAYTAEMAPPHPLKVMNARTRGITLHEPKDAVNTNHHAGIQPVNGTKITTPTGTNNVLVILVQFPNGGSGYTGAPNGTMTNNVAYFQGLCSATTAYFTTVSYGQLTVNFTVDPNMYTLSNPMDYYGAPAVGQLWGDTWTGNPLGGGIGFLISEAVVAADPNNNFANYDSIMIYHAGAGEEGDTAGDSPNDIWSARWWGFSIPTSDGVNITAAIIDPETESQDGNTFSSLGVTCHEYGHELGLPDLYDTSYTNDGIGKWGLMSAGSWNGPGTPSDGSSPAHPCAWSKVYLGWITPTVLMLSQPGINILQVETNAVIFRVNISATEYFLIENKQLVNYDQFLPGCGLLIWHIDTSVMTMDYDGNGTNNWNDNHLQWIASQKFVDLEEADGSGHLDVIEPPASYNNGDANDPYYAGNPQMSPSPDEFSPTSDGAGPGDAQGVTGPQSNNNSGTATRIAITNMSVCGDTMIFDISLPPPVSSLTPENVPNHNQQMCSLSRNHITQAEDLIVHIQQLVEEARTRGKDTAECETLLEQAKEALEKASLSVAGSNCITANNWALRAIELVTGSKECLENARNLSDNSKYDKIGNNDEFTGEKDVKIKKIVLEKNESEKVTFNFQKRDYRSILIFLISIFALFLAYWKYKNR